MGSFSDYGYRKGDGVVAHLTKMGYDIVKGKCYRGYGGNNVCYAAVKTTDCEGNPQTMGVVFQYEFRRAGDVTEFTYKPVSEDMGPVQRKCPSDILSLLSPIFYDGSSAKWAKEWRNACVKFNEKKARDKAWLKKIKVGTVVIIPEDKRENDIDRAMLVNKRNNVWDCFPSSTPTELIKYRSWRTQWYAGAMTDAEIVQI